MIAQADYCFGADVLIVTVNISIGVIIIVLVIDPSGHFKKKHIP
jgi:hypothetical protein